MTPAEANIENLTDLDLIQMYRKDPSSKIISTLFKRHMTTVFGVCMKHLKGEAEARDASMDVFEQLIDLLKKHEVQHFRSWLYMVTKNHCLMLLRKQKGIPQPEENEPADPDAFVESAHNLHPINKQQEEAVFEALDDCLEQLKPEQQQCVRLFFLEEKCYKLVAEATGYAMSKVKSYIQNGKRNLKICIEQKNEQLA